MIKINYRRHAGQHKVLCALTQKNALINLIVAPRGWGKTIFGTFDIVLPVMLTNPNSQVMWVAPIYKQAKACIDDAWFGVDEKTNKKYIMDYDFESKEKIFDYKSSEMCLHMANGARLYLRSADNPDSIVSKGFNLIVVDEAALISKEVFYQHILPTARRENCRIVLITTPRGRNYIYELYLKGKEDKNFFSIKQTWRDRPDYPKILLELMNSVPEHIRKQEFECEFIDSINSVFRNIDKVFEGKEIHFENQNQKWVAENIDYDNEYYICAVDFAKLVDYNVIVVMGIESKRLVYYERFNQVDYSIVIKKLKDICSKFSCPLIYDATGVGQGIGDFLSNEIESVPFTFTSQSKNEIINKLSMAFDNCLIKLPNITTIRNEFELFEYEINRTGRLSYRAPDGKHDDCVMAIAMAYYYALENSASESMKVIDDYLKLIEQEKQKSFLDTIFENDD
jgi:hypothetical protein